MKQFNLLLTLFYLLAYNQSFTQTNITDASLEANTSYTWDIAGSPYILDGFVYLEEGGQLTIEPGVVVQGKELPTNGDLSSMLIISQFAQIYAIGEPNAPIIFTTEIDDLSDPNDLTHEDRGLWGGLALLGNAYIEDVSCPNVGGVLPFDPRSAYGNCANPINNESSGILRFVSIRHGGAEVSVGNEVNALTLGAVGSSTLIEYVETFASQDDGFEMLGGTVELKYITAAFNGDDAIDFDTGWRGKAQFIFTINGNDSGDNGAEFDGAIPDNGTLFSSPSFYNATFIGSAISSQGLQLRDAAGGIYGNSIFTSFETGIQIEQNDAQAIDCLDHLVNGDLIISNNIFWDNQNYVGFTGTDETTITDHLASNNNQQIDPQLNAICYEPTGCLKPLPNIGSPALNNAAAPLDPAIENTTFIGAFDENNFWIKSWTALEEYGYLGNGIGIFGDLTYSPLSGNIIHDANSDCIQDAGETGLTGWNLTIASNNNNNSYQTVTRLDGTYSIFLPDNDNYTVTISSPTGLWNVCNNNQISNFQNNAFDEIDFLVNASVICPYLTTDIGSAFLRRCFDRNIYFNYCNLGTENAPGAYLQVRYDSLLSIVSASAPYMEVAPNVYEFDLGDLDVNECGTITILTNVSCDAALGQTHCIEAEIFPNDLCDTAVDRPIIETSATCEGDSISLILTNVGQVEMDQIDAYIVIEDHVMFNEGGYQLELAETMTIKRPANGSTYRLETIESPGFPEYGISSVMIEGCGNNTSGGFSTGIVTSFTQDDEEPYIDILCQQNIGAYDPNDKQVFPGGYGDEHIILANTPLEYFIRFQNTGTDTAFNVVIIDTLADELELSTFRPTIASHFYEVEIENRVVKFSFPNIMLPDSNINEQNSHGFIRFDISPRSDLSLGTRIENNADIYFDFNDPIRTNTTFNTIGEYDIVINDVNEPNASLQQIKVYPNPFKDVATFITEAPLNKGSFHLFNGLGQAIQTTSFSGSQFNFDGSLLEKGLYYYQIKEKGRLIGSGKVILK